MDLATFYFEQWKNIVIEYELNPKRREKLLPVVKALRTKVKINSIILTKEMKIAFKTFYKNHLKERYEAKQQIVDTPKITILKHPTELKLIEPSPFDTFNINFGSKIDINILKYNNNINYQTKCKFCSFPINRKCVCYLDDKCIILSFNPDNTIHPCQQGFGFPNERCVKCEEITFGYQLNERCHNIGVIKSNIIGVPNKFLEIIRWFDGGFVIYDNGICNHLYNSSIIFFIYSLISSVVLNIFTILSIITR